MIKELDCFLNAIANRLENHVGVFVPKSTCLPTKFPAIKTHTLQVWVVNGTNQTMISEVIVTARDTEASETESIRQELLTKTMENILKWYGI